MKITRTEIDLREQIADEITKIIDSENISTAYQAIGVVRSPIWHGGSCPCSRCSKFNARSCSDSCDRIRKINADEQKRLESAMAHYENTLFYCGYCNNGQNEWQVKEMLFDANEEICVTPCCHTEATEALKCYCPEDACEADDDSLARQERTDYLWSQGAR